VDWNLLRNEAAVEELGRSSSGDIRW